MSHAPARVDESLEALVGQVADEFLRRQRVGEHPRVEEYVARYPQAAALLRPVLASLGLLDLSQPGHPVLPTEHALEAATGTLGDFRLLREVGRGGMGVVYEAEQISLGRRVALKVLPFASTLDPKQLQRFKNEAQAAASLHHQHIVPVYATGCERGVHYYAMQLIAGRTLATVIAGLRRLTGLEGGDVRDDPVGAASAAVEGGTSGRSRASPAGTADSPPTGPYVPEAEERAEAEVTTAPVTALATADSVRDPGYFRTVARLGVQAAEALEHAHQLGVVHRDVKPANLLVDDRGNLWVTDFGLAHCQSQAGLTMTGDLVGTLRYMSPEQALAQRVLVDHRTDVYSLGVTLYELLTLEPAFNGRDRQELLRQIAFEEPRPPRRGHPGVPADLETIVLKAIAKSPAERYATAQALADDLERWLKDEPIRARRPTVIQRARKWARRHRPVVWSAAVCLLLALMTLTGSVGWALRDRAARQAVLDQGAAAAMDEAADLYRRGRLPEALAMAEHARVLSAPGPDDGATRRRAERLVADLGLALALEGVRPDLADVKDERYGASPEIDRRYAELFRGINIDVDRLAADEAATRIRARGVSVELAAALDHWAMTRKLVLQAGPERWTHLLAVARAADADEQRNRLRDALERGDRKALVHTARSADPGALPAPTLYLLGLMLRVAGEPEEAAVLLRKAQDRHPNDFWINTELVGCLWVQRPAKLEAAQRFATAAAVLRPQGPAAYYNLGVLLRAKGAADEAVAACRHALRLKPRYASAYNGLGNALKDQHLPDDAIAAYRRAIDLQTDRVKLAQYHVNVGAAYLDKGMADEAIAAGERAKALAPEDARVHVHLGEAYHRKGDAEKAMAAWRRALACNRAGAHAYQDGGIEAQAHNNLAIRLKAKGDLDGAVEHYLRSIEADPTNARPHHNLGVAWKAKGRPDEAVAEFRKALALDAKGTDARLNLGATLCERRDYAGAAEVYLDGLALTPRDARLHYNLANALRNKGDLDGAIAHYREAIRHNGRYVSAYNNLGAALEAKGDWAGAIDAFGHAIGLNPKHARAHFNLGHARHARGDLAGAVAAYRESLCWRADDAETHCFLAMALRSQGQFTEALTHFKRGDDLGRREPGWRHPSAQWVRECERLVELETRLSRSPAGERTARDPQEGIALAQVCYLKQRFAEAARFYEEALTAQPALAEDLKSGRRYNAACSAALAGCGRGKGAAAPDEKARARLRRLALA